MRRIENTRRDWGILYAEYQKGECKDRAISVVVGAETQASADITNLRYVFPLAAWLYEQGLVSAKEKFTVNILPDPRDEKRDMLWRVPPFLANMNTTEYVSLQIAGTELRHTEWKTSRVFPLCQVAAKDMAGKDGTADYLELRRSRPRQADEGNGAAGGRNLFFRLADTLQEYFGSSGLFTGTGKHNIELDAKEELRKTIQRWLDEWLGEMDVLSRMIWMLILRELINNKELILLYGAENKWDFREDILTKSRMDAVAYGEAIYQLVENACLHSEGKRAWFGFRVHHAGKNAPMSRFAEEASARNRLYEKYKLCFSQSSSMTEGTIASADNIFNGDSSYFFEFFVMDSAIQQFGMVDHYNKTADTPLWSIDELLHIAPRELPAKDDPDKHVKLEEHIESITVHYGLRLLRSILSVNNGYLMSLTPRAAGGSLRYFNGAAIPPLNPSASCYVTEWMAILPITYRWEGLKSLGGQVFEGRNLFGEQILPPRKTVYCLNGDTLLRVIAKDEEKRTAIAKLREALLKRLPLNSIKKLSESIVWFRITGEPFRDLELLAKALFAWISEVNFTGVCLNLPVGLRIAVLLSSVDALHELLRLFSVFYYEGRQKDMEDVQIAFCSPGRDGESYRVNFVLAGESLSSASVAARVCAYHHSENALNHLPLLDYLANQITGAPANDGSAVPSLFPFDLFLPPQFSETGNGELPASPWKESWFLQHITSRLHKDIRSAGDGCMIDNIHIRLGSKLHMERFFEGELLFHDAGNILRFAYLLAQNLIHGDARIPVGRHILLLGYEKYSATLMLQLEYWLKKSNHFGSVQTAIVFDSEEAGKVVFKRCYDETGCPAHNNVQIISVVPVGSTLSTVYKLRNTAYRELRNQYAAPFAALSESHDPLCPPMYTPAYDPADDRNFCLVLANQDLVDGSISGITKQYWSGIDSNRRLVTVLQEKSAGKPLEVMYLLAAQAEWFAPDACKICSGSGVNSRAIIGARHSQTMPASIFTIWGPRRGKVQEFLNADKKQEENRARIRGLYGAIHYSHICDENNHFQFYLDFIPFYFKQREDIDSVIRTWEVPSDAFHVVVSPLQFSNSPFLRAVVDLVFHGNARILHIDLPGAYREEIRSKFSYIAEEFAQLKRVAPNAKFCVHYADNSIVSGERLNRARLLMRMLINQSGVLSGALPDNLRNDLPPTLFSKVFLLVNRCSPDTARSFVQDVTDDLFAYIYLAVPSYNTYSDSCPACRVVGKYALLEKRSVTERLSVDFVRLGEKHKKRRKEEYDVWLETEITSKHSYYEWLKQWLYVNAREDAGVIFSFAPEKKGSNIITAESPETRMDLERVRSIRMRFGEYAGRLGGTLHGAETTENRDMPKEERASWQLQAKLKALSKCTLNDVADVIDSEEEKRKFLDDAIHIVRNYMLAARNYMRLYAMQRAYEELDRIGEDSKDGSRDDAEGRSQLTRKYMLALIAGAMLLPRREKPRGWPGTPDTGSVQTALLCHDIEWLISFVKVLSREQISNYYHCRQAIVSIVGDMLRLLGFKTGEAFEPVTPGKQNPYAAVLTKEDSSWGAIVKVLKALQSTSDGMDGQLCAQMEYQLTMILIHRMADLQTSFVAESDDIICLMNRYSMLLTRFSADGDIPAGRLYFELPTYERVMLQYLKSLKMATMLTEDDIPCIALTKVSAKLNRIAEQRAQCRTDAVLSHALGTCARYIFLENTRMLYSGMKDLEQSLPPELWEEIDLKRPMDEFTENMRRISLEVNNCLSACYWNLDDVAKKEDILYQNMLGGFCRFWHESTGEAPAVTAKEAKNGMRADRLPFLLQYFRRLNSLSFEKAPPWAPEQLPYLYEELCRLICGFTGFQMCYIAFRGSSSSPQIFTQSGFYKDFMLSGRILKSADLDKLLRRFKGDGIYGNSAAPVPPKGGGRQDCTLISGVAQLSAGNGPDEYDDYMVVSVSRKGESYEDNQFFIILQADKHLNLFTSAQSPLPCFSALQKARDILFMRQRLQEVLSRDYTVLSSLRFDTSYVRPIRADPAHEVCLVHISDLHVKDDVSSGAGCKADKITGTIKGSLADWENSRVDLLAITGDIIDGRDANAPQIEENYRHAENLLNRIVSELWSEDGYLPHDWRRRVLITTGNHDYAAMNQFVATVRRRALTLGIPVENESGTMSKFAYYIDFLIRYLDPPIGELIRSDLNEVRYYKQLDMKVLLLNCSGTAVPRRTNKIGVDHDKVAALLQERLWVNGQAQHTPFALCLAHYAHTYSLSYFLDDYDVLPGWEWDPKLQKSCPINEVVNKFLMSVQHKFFVLTGESAGGADFNGTKEFCESFHNFEHALDALDCGKPSPSSAVDAVYNRLNSMTAPYPGKTAQQIVMETRKNDLYLQIKKYYDWLTTVRCPNKEQISQLIYETMECYNMSQYDAHCFRSTLKTAGAIDLYLAGHVHAYSEEDKVLVADKLFYDGSAAIRGYVIKLRKKGGKYTYQHRRFS